MRYVLATIVVLLLTVSCSLANMVPNPGFEDGANGTCTAWNVTEAGVPGTGGVVASWTSEEAHTGKRSLRLQMTGDNEGWILVGSPFLPVAVGYDYEVSFWYKATGLRPETADRQHYSALIEDTFLDAPHKFITNHRIMVTQDSPEWQRAAITFHVSDPQVATLQVRLSLSDKMPGLKPVVYIDDVDVEPLDAALPNAGFEVGQAGPDGWQHTDIGNPAWTTDQAHGGKRSVSLTEPPTGKPSAWYTLLPCRPDRKYGLTGWIKTAKVSPNSTPPGAYLSLTFLDASGAVVGAPALSPPLAGDTDWTQATVAPVTTPAGAFFLRVAGEMVFCHGTAWFDDFALTTAPAEAASASRVARVLHGPQPGIQYAPNLLKNPDAEDGANGSPTGWTYVGKPDPDWTADELDRYYHSGYPAPDMGRGHGEWSDDAFAGKHSLLIVPVDPPLSKLFRWYGRGEVNAYWQSDPMPCTPGAKYLASAWIKMTYAISANWRGPLVVLWYDAQGREIRQGPSKEMPQAVVRPAMELFSNGQWAWDCTGVYHAPANAATMRLRFTQSLGPDAGSFGRMWGDDFAVWQLPPAADTLPAPPPFQTGRFLRWFFAVHQQVRPPYLPAPEFLPNGDTAFGAVSGPATGNIFFDPTQPAPLTVTVRNPLAEQRQLQVSLVKYDWQGNRTNLPPVSLTVDAWGEATVPATLPPSGKYDCAYLEATIAESGAPTGTGIGRISVLPKPIRPRYAPADSHWQVMPLITLSDWSSPYAQQLGQMIKLAGYGSVRVNYYEYGKGDQAACEAYYAEMKPQFDFYRNLGLDIVINIGYPGKEVGANLARVLGDAVAVWDVGGVEQANHNSPFRAAGGGTSDEAYDQLVSDTIDGIRSVRPDATIMGGTIASDMEAGVLQRWYKDNVAQKLAGFTFNAYAGESLIVRNNLAMMDKNGEPNKYAWIEEIPAHDCPYQGPARRYAEKNAAAKTVRTYVSLLSDYYPRFRRITSWSFTRDGDDTYNVITPDLGPRPQYQAIVVLTDKFGRAVFDKSLGSDRMTIYRWREGARTLGILWSTVGEQSVTLETPSVSVTVTDLMGNATRLPVKGGLVTLPLTETPVYLEGAGDFTVSTRLQVSLTHTASALDGPPLVRVTLRNNSPQRLSGSVALSGATPLDPASAPFDLAAGQDLTLTAQVLGDPPISRRDSYRAVATTKEGYVFIGVADLDFVRAAHAAAPPALDGSWTGWQSAPVIRVADAEHVIPSNNPGVPPWAGPNDCSFNLRLMWDDQNLYLGVEVTDNLFKPQPQPGFEGFAGDSIEFAVQADNILQPRAPFAEFEMFLPGAQQPPRLNWRFPSRQVTGWSTAVKPTGHNGDVNYQVALPWSQLGVKTPQPGKVISFALVVNDVDNDQFTGGRRWLYWFGKAIGYEKNPTGYGDVVLSR